ncbi:SRPBCC domain-containing protein [Caulobacter vibrioides]|uniref:SRPBCC domain-containing protein n=1 Tax=Caulobacter vibrioides TaxID=155892 RepID=A0A290MPP9_CAUVI|nr:SRPBCC domain-containing protein [Caulobacter vibrioides]ATC34037.1 SRPBCC domain-containing protein [Caulobacter vibrioides]
MQRAVEHRIGVQAPAEVVWEVVSDFEGWAQWNPLYRKAEGVMKVGSTLVLEQHLPGQAPTVIQPVVQDWVPYEQLHWRSSRLGGFVTAIRYLEIESMGPASATFSNGELFMGLLLRFVSRDERRQLKAAFTQMGEAVRDRAEAIWSERSKSTV